jgi:hypothetical protein
VNTLQFSVTAYRQNCTTRLTRLSQPSPKFF